MNFMNLLFMCVCLCNTHITSELCQWVEFLLFILLLLFFVHCCESFWYQKGTIGTWIENPFDANYCILSEKRLFCVSKLLIVVLFFFLIHHLLYYWISNESRCSIFMKKSHRYKGKKKMPFFTMQTLNVNRLFFTIHTTTKIALHIEQNKSTLFTVDKNVGFFLKFKPIYIVRCKSM